MISPDTAHMSEDGMELEYKKSPPDLAGTLLFSYRHISMLCNIGLLWG